MTCPGCTRPQSLTDDELRKTLAGVAGERPIGKIVDGQWTPAWHVVEWYRCGSVSWRNERCSLVFGHSGDHRSEHSNWQSVGPIARWDNDETWMVPCWTKTLDEARRWRPAPDAQIADLQAGVDALLAERLRKHTMLDEWGNEHPRVMLPGPEGVPLSDIGFSAALVQHRYLVEVYLDNEPKGRKRLPRVPVIGDRIWSLGEVTKVMLMVDEALDAAVWCEPVRPEPEKEPDPPVPDEQADPETHRICLRCGQAFDFRLHGSRDRCGDGPLAVPRKPHAPASCGYPGCFSAASMRFGGDYRCEAHPTGGKR